MVTAFQSEGHSAVVYLKATLMVGTSPVRVNETDRMEKRVQITGVSHRVAS